MSNTSTAPSQIALGVPQRILQITWADGHVSQYDFDRLRRHCPCADCNLGKLGEPPDKLKAAHGDIARAEDLRLVGSYALNIRFADGHGTGIYTWQYLRALGEWGNE